jgi:hypothetical protein
MFKKTKSKNVEIKNSEIKNVETKKTEADEIKNIIFSVRFRRNYCGTLGNYGTDKIYKIDADTYSKLKSECKIIEE